MNPQQYQYSHLNQQPGLSAPDLKACYSKQIQPNILLQNEFKQKLNKLKSLEEQKNSYLQQEKQLLQDDRQTPFKKIKSVNCNKPELLNAEILSRVHTQIPSSIRNKRFTKEEDEMLMRAINIYGRGNWDKVAEYFPNRNPLNVRSRFYTILQKANYNKRKEENQNIVMNFNNQQINYNEDQSVKSFRNNWQEGSMYQQSLLQSQYANKIEPVKQKIETTKLIRDLSEQSYQLPLSQVERGERLDYQNATTTNNTIKSTDQLAKMVLEKLQRQHAKQTPYLSQQISVSQQDLESPQFKKQNISNRNLTENELKRNFPSKQLYIYSKSNCKSVYNQSNIQNLEITSKIPDFSEFEANECYKKVNVNHPNPQLKKYIQKCQNEEEKQKQERIDALKQQVLQFEQMLTICKEKIYKELQQ